MSRTNPESIAPCYGCCAIMEASISTRLHIEVENGEGATEIIPMYLTACPDCRKPEVYERLKEQFINEIRDLYRRPTRK